jgi:hypothetical protein
MAKPLQAGLAAAALTLPRAPACTAAAQQVRTHSSQYAPGAPATLDDLKGMLGNWSTRNAAAAFSAPAAGEVVGHLLLVADTGQPRVQEMWVLRPEGGSVVLRQKHYAPDLKDREDKDKWGERKLVARDAGHLYFDNLTLVTKGDAMDLLVRLPGANGAPPTLLTYNLLRVK